MEVSRKFSSPGPELALKAFLKHLSDPEKCSKKSFGAS